MLDSNDLLKTIKQAALDAVDTSNPTRIMFGTVIGTSPLRINVEQKMVLDSAQLILTRNVSDYNADIELDWDTAEDSFNHTHKHSSSVNVHFSDSQNAKSEVMSEIGGDPEHQHQHIVKHDHNIAFNLNGNFNANITDDSFSHRHKHKVSGRRKIKIYNALHTGEEVILIQSQGGQKFIVMDRVVST